MNELARDARGAIRRRGPAQRGRIHLAALPVLAPMLTVVLAPVLAPVLAVVLAACGGRPAPQSPPSPPRSGASDAARSGDGAGEPADGTAPAGQPGTGAAGAVTEAECQALLAHVVAIANQAHARTVTPETAPTEAQLAGIRERMAPEFIPLCLGLDRASITCQMRASTRDQLLACM